MWDSGVLLLAFYFAIQGAVIGLLWAGAFHIRLWLGAAVGAGAGALLGAILAYWLLVLLRKPVEEAGAFLGKACGAPLLMVALVGGIVWLVRALA